MTHIGDIIRLEGHACRKAHADGLTEPTYRHRREAWGEIGPYWSKRVIEAQRIEPQVALDAERFRSRHRSNPLAPHLRT